MKKGTIVYLRGIKDEDIESIYRSCQDQETLYMTGTRTSFTLDQIKESYQRFNQDPSRYDFAICSMESHEIIGDLAIMDIDPHNKKAGFRIALHSRNTWNKCYGTEATQLALAFAFEDLQLNRLELEVFSYNVRGMKAYEKAGFIKEGTLRQSLYWNHAYSDEILIGLLRDDYNKR